MSYATPSDVATFGGFYFDAAEEAAVQAFLDLFADFADGEMIDSGINIEALTPIQTKWLKNASVRCAVDWYKSDGGNGNVASESITSDGGSATKRYFEMTSASTFLNFTGYEMRRIGLTGMPFTSVRIENRWW